MINIDNDKLIIALAVLAHEIAIELDLHYEDEDLATMAARDGSCRGLRQAVAVLRESGGPVSDVVEHVEGRMSRAYEGGFWRTAAPGSADGSHDHDVLLMGW